MNAHFSDSRSPAATFAELPPRTPLRLPRPPRWLIAIVLVLALAAGSWLAVDRLPTRPPAEQTPNALLNPDFRHGMTELWTLPGALSPVATTPERRRLLLHDPFGNQLILVDARTGAEVWRKATRSTMDFNPGSCLLASQTIAFCIHDSGVDAYAMNDQGTELEIGRGSYPLGGPAKTMVLLHYGQGAFGSFEIYDPDLKLVSSHAPPPRSDGIWGENEEVILFVVDSQTSRPDVHLIAKTTGKQVGQLDSRIASAVDLIVGSDGFLIHLGERWHSFDNQGRPTPEADQLDPALRVQRSWNTGQNPATIAQSVETLHTSQQIAAGPAGYFSSRGSLAWITMPGGIVIGSQQITLDLLDGQLPDPDAIIPCADASCVLVQWDGRQKIVSATGELLHDLDPDADWTPVGNYLARTTDGAFTLYRANRW